MIELGTNQVELVSIQGRGVDMMNRYSGFARLVAEDSGDRVRYRFQCEFIPGYDFGEVEIDEEVVPVYRLYPIEKEKHLVVAQKTLFGCLYRYVYSMVDMYAFTRERGEGYLDHFNHLKKWGSGLWRFEDELEGDVVDLDDEGYSTFDPSDDIDEAATIEVENEWLGLFKNAFMRDEELVNQSEMWADMFLR